MNPVPNPATSPAHRILVIDDEAVVCLSCERVLSAHGFQVRCLKDPKRGLEEALSGNYDLILLDIIMPELDGMEILGRLKNAGVSAEVIVMTGYAAVDTAVKAMKLGAADYMSKPFTPDELLISVRRVTEHSALIRENIALRRQLATTQGFEGIIGESRKMQQVFSSEWHPRKARS
jgi:DNA-binding NtrC family response regulator